MHFTTSIILSAVAITTAAGGLIDRGSNSSPNPGYLLDKRQESINCETDTSPLCGTRLGDGPRACDDAINNLRRGPNYYLYAAST